MYPYFTYCNLTWSSTYATNLNIIFLIQKRVVRAITNAPYRAHKLNSFHIAKFMFFLLTNYNPLLFSVSSPEVVIFMSTTPEPPPTTVLTFAERTSSSLLFYFKVQESGMLCQLISLVRHPFSLFGKNPLVTSEY